MTYDKERQAEGPDDIARLIAGAGKRPVPPAQIHESARAAVEQAWNESTSQRTSRRRALWLSAAGVAAMTFGLIWLALQRPSAEASDAATLLAARGEVTVTTTQDRQLIVAGSRLPAGTTVRTAKTGFVLMTVASVTMHVGPQSTLRIGRAGRVRLTDGRLYVESAVASEPSPPLIVLTPFGQVSHLGTQFQVIVDSAAMTVSVRSGHVRVKEPDDRVQRLTEGDGLEVHRDGTVQRITVAPYGASWAWVDSLVPDFPIDGRPLSEFLAWYTRETGLKLVLMGPRTVAAVRRTTLSGSIAGLTPNQALAAVMATTDLECDMSMPGEIRVRMRGRADRGK